MLALQQQLGYVNGRPPKDIARRFSAYMAQHADGLTKAGMQGVSIPGLPPTDLRTRMVTFLYFTQPGGTAEACLIRRMKEYRLPGFVKGEHGSLSGFVGSRDLEAVFPATRSFTATKQGDTSKYHYTVFRASQDSAWTLQRAWRTTPDGRVAEEYPVE